MLPQDQMNPETDLVIAREYAPYRADWTGLVIRTVTPHQGVVHRMNSTPA